MPSRLGGTSTVGRNGSDKPKATHASAEPGSGSSIITRSMANRSPPSCLHHRDNPLPMRRRRQKVSFSEMPFTCDGNRTVTSKKTACCFSKTMRRSKDRFRTTPADGAPSAGNASRPANRSRTGRIHFGLLPGGCSQKPFGEAAASESRCLRGRHVEALSDARTKPEGFFNILPGARLATPGRTTP